jgi:hypothetical protein
LSGGATAVEGLSRRRALGGAVALLGGSVASPLASAGDVIDARYAVLCSWIFDRGVDRASPAPFGFDLMWVFQTSAAGYLGALLRTADVTGRSGWVLVNRGTRFDTRSLATLLRGLAEDMDANAGIQFGRTAVPVVDAALRAMEEAVAMVRRETPPGGAAATPDGFPLRTLGQSPGGGLAQLQAIAAWHRARTSDPTWPRLRFTTFAASDVSYVVARRFGLRAEDLPAEIGVNHVAARDGLTGPRSLFGPSRIGVQHVVAEMEGTAPLGLDVHRAGAWVNQCAGQPVGAPEPAFPATGQDWARFARRCHVPVGWPAMPG